MPERFWPMQKQKTSIAPHPQRLPASGHTGRRKCGVVKVFCFFFSKKKAFLA